jgi:cytochrome c-type biogenesis protein CcmH/NrfG
VPNDQQVLLFPDLSGGAKLVSSVARTMMTDIQAELKRLSALRDQGVLSEADYQAQRARLLENADETFADADEAGRRRWGLKLIGLVVAIVLLALALGALGRCSHQTYKLPPPRRAPNMIPASRSPPVAMGTGQMTNAVLPAATGDGNEAAAAPLADSSATSRP